MARIGVSKDLRAQIPSHGMSGAQTKHYDRYSHLDEKRDALMIWCDYLEKIANGDEPQNAGRGGVDADGATNTLRRQLS